MSGLSTPLSMARLAELFLPGCTMPFRIEEKGRGRGEEIGGLRRDARRGSHRANQHAVATRLSFYGRPSAGGVRCALREAPGPWSVRRWDSREPARKKLRIPCQGDRSIGASAVLCARVGA